MGWGSATGLRVIGVATKKSFPAYETLQVVRLSSLSFSLDLHYSVFLFFFFFLPQILISYRRCKNIVPQYSILHYIIEGTDAKSATISRPRSWNKTRGGNISSTAVKKPYEQFSKRIFLQFCFVSVYIKSTFFFFLFFISCFFILRRDGCCWRVAFLLLRRISTGNDFKLRKEVNKSNNK